LVPRPFRCAPLFRKLHLPSFHASSLHTFCFFPRFFFSFPSSPFPQSSHAAKSPPRLQTCKLGSQFTLAEMLQRLLSGRGGSYELAPGRLKFRTSPLLSRPVAFPVVLLPAVQVPVVSLSTFLLWIEMIPFSTREKKKNPQLTSSRNHEALSVSNR